MNRYKPKHKTPTPFTYGPHPVFTAIWGGIVIPAVVIGIIDLFGRLSQLETGVFSVLLSVSLAAIGALLIWYAWQRAFANRVIVWESGLESYINGVHCFVYWKDLKRLGLGMHGMQSVWGVYAPHADRQEISFWTRWSPFAKPTDFIPLGQVVFILNQANTRRADLERFLQTPLGQDLLHYAPHLFDVEKVKHDKRDVSRLTTEQDEQSGSDTLNIDQQGEQHEQS